MHGKASQIRHDGTSVFEGLPSPFAAIRYHSLCVGGEAVPSALRTLATSEDGVVQGIAHRELPLIGVQFHPESVLTEHGRRLAGNFLELARR
jgi:anthranilate/para-aminobenzoate synthase component II